MSKLEIKIAQILLQLYKYALHGTDGHFRVLFPNRKDSSHCHNSFYLKEKLNDSCHTPFAKPCSQNQQKLTKFQEQIIHVHLDSGISTKHFSS
jgi:hypothetical protein